MKKKKGVLFRSALALCLLIAMSVGELPFSTVLPDSAYAGTSKSYQDEIDAAKKKKQEMEKAQKELEEKIKELKEQQASIEEYIASLDEKMNSLLEEIELLETEIAVCEETLEETRVALEEARIREADQYDTMKRRIQYMYENGETGFLDLLLGEGSLSEMLNQMEYRREITKYDDALLERYEETKLQVAQTEELLEVQLEELNSLKLMQESELAAVTELSEAKSQEMLELVASIGVDEEMLFNFWEEIVEQGADIERLEKLEAERIAEEERKRKEEEERLKRLEQLKKDQSIENMLWPIPASTRITSYFGYRKSPTKGASTYHRGIDVGAPTGTLVRAAIAGTVTGAGYGPSTGNYVVIDHGNGVVTKYYHASKILVKKGDYVQRGQNIMKVGSTGVSTGPHLHFGLFLNGVAVNPLDYVSTKDMN